MLQGSKLKHKLILASLFYSNILFASSASLSESVDQNFTFKLHTTDVLLWAEGSRKGHVHDAKGYTAERLDELLLSAKKSIDVAIYGVQDQEWIFDRLKTLVGKHIKIRVIIDQKSGALNDWNPANFNYPDTSRLAWILEKGHTKPDVSPDNKPRAGSIMHNKFIIIDGHTVWTGSTNLSATCLGADYNANSSITISSPAIAKIYSAEFEQMYQNRKFSIYKTSSSHARWLSFKDKTKVRVFFSPQDNVVDQAIIPFIEDSKETLDIAMFYLTHTRIADAITKAHRRGVKVRLLYDALAGGNPYSLHHELRKKGIDVRVENWGGKMHMKTAIADGKHILMGSMNWSNAGNRSNDENTLVIRNNLALGQELQSYFNTLWKSLDDIYSAATKMITLLPRINDPHAEGLDSINSCFDGIDNNYNGLTDEEDPACQPRSF